ncbi:MAG: hypothetical protein ACK56I_19060, partial [bacterium]
MPGGGQGAGQLDELPVAAGAHLRATDHDEHGRTRRARTTAGLVGALRGAQHAHQALALAGEQQRGLDSARQVGGDGLASAGRCRAARCRAARRGRRRRGPVGRGAQRGLHQRGGGLDLGGLPEPGARHG